MFHYVASIRLAIPAFVSWNFRRIPVRLDLDVADFILVSLTPSGVGPQ